MTLKISIYLGELTYPHLFSTFIFYVQAYTSHGLHVDKLREFALCFDHVSSGK